MKVVKRSPVTIQGSTFSGFSADVKDLQEVNELYAKIRAENLKARHVVCAFRIPHRNFAIYEDYFDDDEDGMGAFLLQLLRCSEINNKVIFVVCDYDGTHIGKQQFSGCARAVKSCFVRAPYNAIAGENQFLWDGDHSESKQLFARPIRGNFRCMERWPHRQKSQRSGTWRT